MTALSGFDAMSGNDTARFSSALSIIILAAAVMAAIVLALMGWTWSAAQADEERRSQGSFSIGSRFTESTGEQLFANVCQGCHMTDGGGATGAANYPSLAKDANLEAGGYPVYVVVRGQRAMPPVGAMMSDDQVAAVVNYVRTHFGNQYQDAVTAEDVKRVRP
jgi:mono/diheme cytochrome c family protein